MREIIFRGKRADNGEWVYGSLITERNMFDGNLMAMHIQDIEEPYDDNLIDDETVGQFTGLTDKNGTRIFEGDIVKGKSEYFGNGSLNQKAVVLYDRGQFLLSFGETLEECKQLNDFEVVGVWSGDVEVIGNIHDNFELLNK